MLDGVVVSESKAQKDEIILEGNDVQNVSQSGTSLHSVCGYCVLISPKLRRSRVCAGYGTRISVNSWTVSTCLRRRLLPRSNLIDTSSPCFALVVVPPCILSRKSLHVACPYHLCLRNMTSTMSDLMTCRC